MFIKLKVKTFERNFKIVSVYVLSLYSLKPVECFLLKYKVGQINSITELSIKNLKKLYKKKKTKTSSHDKNVKLLKKSKEKVVIQLMLLEN